MKTLKINSKWNHTWNIWILFFRVTSLFVTWKSDKLRHWNSSLKTHSGLKSSQPILPTIRVNYKMWLSHYCVKTSYPTKPKRKLKKKKPSRYLYKQLSFHYFLFNMIQFWSASIILILNNISSINLICNRIGYV